MFVHRLILSFLDPPSPPLPDEPSRKRLGSYLIQAQLQGSASSSALYLTAAAQNLLCMKLAAEAGVAIPSTWATWFKAASVPALVSVFLTPLVMYKIFPPELKSTPDAPKVGRLPWSAAATASLSRSRLFTSSPPLPRARWPPASWKRWDPCPATSA